jgi:AraC family transcriptional regulator
MKEACSGLWLPYRRCAMTKRLGIITGRFGRVALLDMKTSLTVHAHGFCHVVAKITGPDQTFRVEGVPLPLREDTAVAVNSWQEHSYSHRAGEARSVFLALYLEPRWLAETDRLFSGCGRRALFDRHCVTIGPESAFWRKQLVSMIEHGIDDGALIEQAIVRLTWSIGRRAANHDTRRASAPDFRVRRAMHEMRQFLSRPYDYDALAATVGLSRSRFNVLFKGTIGVAPAVYGNAIRVEASISALAQQHTSIGRVADDLGFSASSNFCRFFQGHTGLAPREYRRATTQILMSDSDI